MTHCPMCGADCCSKEICPLCGSRVDLPSPKEKDAQYLAKDRWTFEDVASDETIEEKTTRSDSSAKPPIARDPTQVMHVFKEMSSHEVKLQEKAEQNTKMGIGRAPTLAIGSLKGPASGKRNETPVNMKSTMLGLSPVNLLRKTVPLPLSQVKSEVGESGQSRDSADDTGTGDQHVDPEPILLTAKLNTPLDTRQDLSPTRARNGPSQNAAQRRSDADLRNSTGQAIALRGRGRPSKANHTVELSICLGISSAILILGWFVPDVWTANSVFSYSLIGSLHGIDLIALLIRPTLGAVLLALLIAPFKPLSKALLGFPVGIGALTVPLVSDMFSLPLKGTIILAIVIINIAVAVFIFTQTEYKVFGHVALVLVPGTLLGIAAIGIAMGKLPSAQVSAIKAPLEIYAATLVCAVCASVIIRSIRKKPKNSH